MAAVYAPNGWIGSIAANLGFKIAFTPLGVVIALVFIGLPFVVRTVQPVLEDVERDIEEASALLGASRLRTVLQVVLPQIYPALLTGFALAFARGVGEYGSGFCRVLGVWEAPSWLDVSAINVHPDEGVVLHSRVRLLVFVCEVGAEPGVGSYCFD